MSFIAITPFKFRQLWPVSCNNLHFIQYRRPWLHQGEDHLHAKAGPSGLWWGDACPS